MLVFNFVSQLLFSILMATVVGVVISVLTLIVCSWIVNLFRLNHLGHSYWALNFSLLNFWISWILIVCYYMSLK